MEDEEEVMRVVGFFGVFAIPADLALRIFVAVPLGRQLFRLRCVCRHWNNLLRSRCFLRAWSQLHNKSCCFVMLPPFPSYPPANVDCDWILASQGSNRPRTHLTAYCVEDPRISNSGYWFELPLQWFDRGQSHEFELQHGDCWMRAIGGGSAAGLVVDMIYSSYMCHAPLIRVHDFLAGTYRWPYTWRVVACIPKPKREELPLHRHGLFENKDIYKGDLFFPLQHTNTLFAYCIESDEWINIELRFPTPCRWDNFPTIMKFEGTRILMAMALFTEERVTGPLNTKRTLYGFVVWELEQNERSGSYEWVELARAPQAFMEVHYDMFWIGFRPRITYSSTLICMTSIIQSKPARTMATWGRCMPPLVYNVVTDSWFYMPPYNGAVDFVSLFSFQPTSNGLLL